MRQPPRSSTRRHERPSGPPRRAGTDPEQVPGRIAAEILGLSYPTRFNVRRELLQLVLDPIHGLRPYPPEFIGTPGQRLDDDVLRRKAAFDASAHLVVIEWGGSKPPRSSWRYSRRQCEDLGARGLAALLDARHAWGLPAVAAEQGRGPRLVRA